MESTLLSASFSKTLISHSTPLACHFPRCFSTTRPIELAHLPLRRCSEACEFSRVGSGSLVRPLRPADLRWNHLHCAASSTPSFASGGGGSDGIDGNGGGGDGDGAAEGGKGRSTAVASGADDASALSEDVILLHVGGMSCGGCAAKVKKILESQVSSANVNLATETATVWPVSEAKSAPNWRKDIGEALANHLNTCGFQSNLKDEGAVEGKVPS